MINDMIDSVAPEDNSYSGLKNFFFGNTSISAVKAYNASLKTAGIASVVTMATKALPKNLYLPIRGFRNPRYHCLVTTPRLLQVIKAQLSMFHAGYYGFLMYTNNYQSIINSLIAKTGYLFSVQFSGVQPISTGIGFSTLKDARINTFRDYSNIHTVLTPYEYFMFNMPVHAVADGVVSEIVDEYQDDMKTAARFSIGEKNTEIILGNVIRISHMPSIIQEGQVMTTSCYAHLKLHSMVVRVGEKVKKGQMIGRVGCSGRALYPFLHFQFETPGIKIPYVNSIRAGISTRAGLWDTHMECELLKENSNGYDYDPDDGFDFYDNFRASDIRYKMKAATLGYCSLVKQFPEIKVE